jgi:hypothetical protein
MERQVSKILMSLVTLERGHGARSIRRLGDWFLIAVQDARTSPSQGPVLDRYISQGFDCQRAIHFAKICQVSPTTPSAKSIGT